jgi:hypothetical protein
LTSNWPCPSPLVDVANWVNDVYLKRRGANASIGSRFAESEPYAWRVASLCCCGPAALQLNNLLSPTFPPLLPHPVCTKNLNYSINPTSSIYQTAPDSPNQGRHAFPWFTIWSNLHLPYKVQLLLLLHWISTYPSYYFNLTALTSVSLKTSTSSLPPVRLKNLNMTGTQMTSLRNAYQSSQ